MISKRVEQMAAEELEVTVLIEQQQVETQLLAMIQWWEQSGSGITPLPDVFLSLLQQWFEEKEQDVLADNVTFDTLLQRHEETRTQQEQEQGLVENYVEEQNYYDKLIVMAILKDEEERHGSPER